MSFMRSLFSNSLYFQQTSSKALLMGKEKHYLDLELLEQTSAIILLRASNILNINCSPFHRDYEITVRID